MTQHQPTEPSSAVDRVFVADLQPGQRIRSVFLVQTKRSDVSRAGSPYLSLTLADRTGVVQARVWELAERYGAVFEAGHYIFVNGITETFRGERQLRVEHLERVDASQVDESEYVRASRFDAEDMWLELVAVLDDVIEDPALAAVLREVLADPDVTEALRRAPAAKANHHAYLAGLLEHTLSLCRLASVVGRHYETPYPGLLSTELLVAGALLHDLGKIWELAAGTTIRYTDVGQLVGHIALGCELLDRAVANAPGLDPERHLRLKHMILSHHGKHEYGAPVLPQTPEAQILHYLDQVDARLNIYAGALEGVSGGWTGWVKPLRRTLYGGPPVAAPDPPAPEARPVDVQPAAAELADPPKSTERLPIQATSKGDSTGGDKWLEDDWAASLVDSSAPSAPSATADASSDDDESAEERVTAPLALVEPPMAADVELKPVVEDEQPDPPIDRFTLDLFS